MSLPAFWSAPPFFFASSPASSWPPGFWCFCSYRSQVLEQPARRGLARALLALIAVGHAWYILRVTDPVGWVLFGVWPLAVVLLAWLRTRRSDEEVLALLRDLTVGSLISAFPLLSYHLAHGALGGWFRDTFVAAMSIPTLGFMQRPGYLMLGILSWRGFQSGELDKVINAGLYTCLLLISALLGVVLFRGLVRGSRSSNHPLPVIATFYALVSLHYQLPIYLFYTVGLSLAAVLLLTSESNSSTRRVTIAVSSVIAGVALYYQAAMPVTRPLKDIVAGERRFPTTPLPSPVAGIYVDTAEARLYQSLVRLIDRETEPGDTIFALPMNTELYFLGRRTNPFRFYNTAVGIRSGADLDSVLQVIRCQPPKLVFYDPTDKYNTPASVRIAGVVRRRSTRSLRESLRSKCSRPEETAWRMAARQARLREMKADVRFTDVPTHPPDRGTTSRPEQSRR